MKQIFFLGLIILILLGFSGVCLAEKDQTAIANGEVSNLRQQIAQILQDSKFNYTDYFSWFPQLLKKVSDWVQKWTQKLSDAVKKWFPKKKPVQDQLFSKVLKWIGLVALCILPFILIYFLPKLFQRTIVLKEKTLPKTELAIHPFSLSEQANRMAENGDYREAIRYLYLANLEYLQKKGLLSDGIRLTDKANLNLLRRKLGNDHLGLQSFSKLTLVFQEKWYGLKECRRSDYDLAVNYLDSIYKLIGKSDV